MKLRPFLMRHALVALALLGSAAVQAQATWPSKPLSLIVPFGAGSSPDVMARMVGEEAGKTLGQTIVVINRPGASGNIGTNSIAKAAPDGYTFGVSITGPLVNNVVIQKDLPYNPAKDIQPLTLGVHQFNVLVVPAGSTIKSLQDLIDTARAPGSKLNFPTTGAGTISHLAVELLLDRVGGKAVHVPYPSSPAAVTSLLGGDTHFAALPPVAVLPMIKDGKVKPIAAVSAQRLSFLPDLPTVAELGFAGIEGSGWIGFVAPAGVDAEIVKKLNQALTGALSKPEVKERLLRMGMEPAPTTPEAFAQYMQEESKRWTPLIERLDLANK